MDETLIAVGDIHLGDRATDAESFETFLQYLENNRDIDQLVLMGDIIDRVKRDTFSVALEHSSILDRLDEVADETIYLDGNHDRHSHRIDPDHHPEITFTDEYTTSQNGTTIRCTHGDEYDRWQFDTLTSIIAQSGDDGSWYEPYAKKLYDATVAIEDLTEMVGEMIGGSGNEYERHYVEKNVGKTDIDEDILIYGHTHQPHVSDDGSIANPGTWREPRDDHDEDHPSQTFLEIEAGSIDLYQFREDDSSYWCRELDHSIEY